jgi:hypothetical protein
MDRFFWGLKAIDRCGSSLGQQSDGSLERWIARANRAMDRLRANTERWIASCKAKTACGRQAMERWIAQGQTAMHRLRANSDGSLGPTAMDRLTANSDGSLKVVAGPDFKQRAPISELQLPSPLLISTRHQNVSSSWNIYIYICVSE